MDEDESLSHTTWDCKYHVMFWASEPGKDDPAHNGCGSGDSLRNSFNAPVRGLEAAPVVEGARRRDGPGR